MKCLLPSFLFVAVALAQNPACRLCSDGSDIPEDVVNRTLIFLGGSQSCRTADEFLGRQANAAACEDARITAFGDQVVDVEAFCSCPNAPAPDICTLCSLGGLVFEELEDLEVVLYGENVTFTCGEVEEIAPFINSPEVCDNGVRLAENSCCGSQPMVPTPPTQAPTMFPTRVPRETEAPGSAAVSDRMGRLALGLVLGGTLVTLLD